MITITYYNFKYDADELKEWKNKSLKNELGIVSNDEYLGHKNGYVYKTIVLKKIWLK